MKTKAIVALSIAMVLFCSTSKKNSDYESSTENKAPGSQLILPLPYFTIVFDNMHGAPTFNKDSLANLDTVHISLGTAGIIDADISNKAFRVINKKVQNIGVWEKLCSNIFFNNDGSGATYTLPTINEHCGSWSPLVSQNRYLFQASSMQVADHNFPKLSEQDIATAETYINGAGKELYASYEIGVSKAFYKLTGSLPDGSIKKIVIIFSIMRGD